MVQKIIVHECGGVIRVESEQEKGTSFHLYFPVSGKVPENLDLQDEDETTELPTGKERIMVVDDEKTIAEMMRSILIGLGYSVNVFTGSDEAMESFAADPGQFDLIITDQTMPGLTGSELAEKVLEIRPEIPIILCTGYSAVLKKEMIDEIGIKEFIMKPFGAEKLAKTIRNLLDN